MCIRTADRWRHEWICCRIGQYDANDSITDAKELANRIFCTVYMGTENSSAATKERARCLADEIGSHHVDACIDSVVAAVVALFVTIAGAVRFAACLPVLFASRV